MTMQQWQMWRWLREPPQQVAASHEFNQRQLPKVPWSISHRKVIYVLFSLCSSLLYPLPRPSGCLSQSFKTFRLLRSYLVILRSQKPHGHGSPLKIHLQKFIGFWHPAVLSSPRNLCPQFYELRLDGRSFTITAPSRPVDIQCFISLTCGHIFLL